MKKILALSLALLAPAAFAVQLNWTAPTTNTDDTPIPATGPGALDSYRIEYGTCAGGAIGTKTGEVVVPATARTHTVAGLAAGTWCFAIRAHNNQNEESDRSNTTTAVVALPKARPLSAVAAAGRTVFYVVQQSNRMAFLPVGTVSAATACDTTQPVGPHFVVPRAGVVWFGNVRPLVVVATCD